MRGEAERAEARVARVVGSLVEASPMRDAALYELVQVGEDRLLGEVIRLRGDTATIQVFEETSGLALEESIYRTGGTLTAELGPGLLGSVLDGVGRPLETVAEQTGPFIAPGSRGRTLDRERRWTFHPERQVGEEVGGGDVLGWVEERTDFRHRVLVPPDVGGRLDALEPGDYRVEDPVGELSDGTPLLLMQRWPVRASRPVTDRLPGDRPFVTGQRVFDFLFPVAEGGSVAVPGGFGTGKTIIEQTLAKYADAEIVVYVGCGERGNEMAEMLSEFPELEDPRTGRPLLDRTVLVVNTSNMPVVAREASVYLGITVGEYFRDMGYRVAVMADSLSRWAEALREIGSRLQEMPGEEGYPTYLANRLGKLYERAGRVRAAGTPRRDGALTFISAVSPPGGDFSEPVTQASLRVAGALWALDASLAHQRHYPAVDWEMSYSLYAERVNPWFAERVGQDWPELRGRTLELLQEGAELREISGLVGPEALEDEDRLTLEAARMVRELVLAQNAFDPVDAFSTARKTYLMASLLLDFRDEARAALQAGRSFVELDLAAARRVLREVRQTPADGLDDAGEGARDRLRRAAGIPEPPEHDARQAPDEGAGGGPGGSPGGAT